MPRHNTRSITKLLICLGRICVDYNDFSSSTTIIISTVLLAAAGWIPRFFRQTRNFFMVLYPLLLTKMWIAPKNVQACVTALLYTRTTLFSPYVTHCFNVETKYGKLHRIMKVSFRSHFKEKFEQVESSKLLDDNHWCKFSISQRDPSFFPTT